MSFNEVKIHGTEDFPFELYEIDFSHPKYEMAHHWHSNVEIIRVLSGSLSVTLNNKTFLASDGETVFVNSETVHGATPNNCVYECIVFNLNFLKTGNIVCDGFLDDLCEHHAYLFDKIGNEKTNPTIERLFKSIRDKKEGYQFLVIGAINELIGILKENKLYTYQVEGLGENENKNVVKLKTVLQFIRQNFDKEITLDDMADAVGFSTKYFCNFFKNMTGKTPVGYLNVYRIEKACKKLLTTDMPITQIAYSCGFNDLSYFIKTFKQIKNCTPKQYRKV